MVQNLEFDVYLLGSDINVYGMARSFHEEYGIIAEAHGAGQLAPTKYSKIVHTHVHENFDDDDVFVRVLKDVASKADKSKKHLLISCGDAYSALIARHLEELKKDFICPYISYDLQKGLTDKVTFYEYCEKYDLPHPQTVIIETLKINDPKDIDIPFNFPVALKPANSVEWLDIHFEGRKKAYRIKTREELNELLLKIKKAGYTSELICQDFIPGDDSNMRVLNAYVGKDHKVKMMCLGHPLLEDPSPASIGNYMVIMPDFNQEIYNQIQSFLEKINYTGFANFDMKYDTRDGKYKLFELNPRQGRSSFYVTLNGYNLARYVVDDYIYQKEMPEAILGKGNKLWMGVPKDIFKTYVKPSEDKNKALKMLEEGNWGTTLFYDKDTNLKRWILLKYMFHHYKVMFKRYFTENKG